MDALYATMFAAGLASGVHCVAMCGGIVAAFDLKRVIPIQQEIRWARRGAFNLGRISSYMSAGAVVLGFGSYGLAHANGLGEAIRRGLLCL